jgi:flagellar basal body-associated protein FliL
MATPPENNSTPDGLELDKISLSGFPQGTAPKPESERKPATAKAGRPATPKKNKPRNRIKTNLPLLAVLAALALFIALATVFKKQDFSISPLKGSEGAVSSPESYLRVGPITTTLANDDIVKVTIDIDCKTPKLKERISGKDSQIRDQIIAALMEPETGALLSGHDYEAVKARIRERIGDLPVGHIYFSELLLY